jgi:hypothetical protein
MKPTIQFNEKSCGDFSERVSQKRSTLPKTDYSFYAAAMAKSGSRCFCSCRPSLRSISRNYFESEEPRSFLSEAALFGVLGLTAALPILNSVTAALHLLRSFVTF